MGFEVGGVGDMIQNQTSPHFRFPEVGISGIHCQVLLLESGKVG